MVKLMTMSGRRFFLYAVGYFIACIVVVWLWDFKYNWNSPFLSNLVVGVLTIIGAVILGYWLYDRDRIKQQRKSDEREKALKQRVVTALDAINERLLSWLFHFANLLSGHFELYTEGKIYDGKYKDDIPELEDIFGIGTHDPKGKRLRGTDQAATINVEVLQRKHNPGDLYHSLNYCKDAIRLIEREVKRFPELLPNVSPKAADLVNLREVMESRWDELRQWEIKNEAKRRWVIDNKASDDRSVRSNMRSLGKFALNIVIAIEKDIEQLNSEIRN